MHGPINRHQFNRHIADFEKNGLCYLISSAVFFVEHVYRRKFLVFFVERVFRRTVCFPSQSVFFVEQAVFFVEHTVFFVEQTVFFVEQFFQ